MMNIQLEPMQIYIGLAITGIFIGLGNAIGQWIFKKHLLTRYEKLKKIVIKKKEKNKQVVTHGQIQ